MASLTYARVHNDLALEIFSPPDGVPFDECFHPHVAAMFELVPDGTEQNATCSGGVWTNPPPPAPEEAP